MKKLKEMFKEVQLYLSQTFIYLKEEEETEIIGLAYKTFIHQLSYTSAIVL